MTTQLLQLPKSQEKYLTNEQMLSMARGIITAMDKVETAFAELDTVVSLLASFAEQSKKQSA